MFFRFIFEEILPKFYDFVEAFTKLTFYVYVYKEQLEKLEGNVEFYTVFYKFQEYFTQVKNVVQEISKLIYSLLKAIEKFPKLEQINELYSTLTYYVYIIKEVLPKLKDKIELFSFFYKAQEYFPKIEELNQAFSSLNFFVYKVVESLPTVQNIVELFLKMFYFYFKVNEYLIIFKSYVESFTSLRFTPKAVVIATRRYSGDVKTVTETSWTLKEEILPDSGFSVLVPFMIRIKYDNPSGSGVTLYIKFSIYYSDGTEQDVYSFEVAEGTSNEKEYPLSVMVRGFVSGKYPKSVRVYAYCSASPASGYEPSIQVTDFAGIEA